MTLKWIPIKSVVLPDSVNEVIQTLKQAGFVVYLVGGWVRDFLLERFSQDYDLVTDALPDRLCELFPNSLQVGKVFGVIKLIADPISIEIATFREDLPYLDHRHPSGIRFSHPEQDAHRRDFTMNALYFDSEHSQVLDFVEGYSDLTSGIVRAIGDPSVRFQEDALRLLRAVRFQVNLNFSLDSFTAEAMKSSAYLLTQVSGERLKDELSRLWLGPRPDCALRTLLDLGFLSVLFPEMILDPQSDGSQECALKLFVEHCPDRSMELSWIVVMVILLQASEELRPDFQKRFRFSQQEYKKIQCGLWVYHQFQHIAEMQEAFLQRWIRQPYFEDLLVFYGIVCRLTGQSLDVFYFCQKKFQVYQECQFCWHGLTGQDLIRLGFKPGAYFASLLRHVEDLVLEKHLSHEQEACEYVLARFGIEETSDKFI